MKPKTFLIAMLFLPYVCWLVALLLSTSRNSLIDYPVLGSILGILIFASVIFMGGIVFWGIPYTLLVIGLLIWSKNKSATKIYIVFFYSPLLLTALTTILFLIIGLGSALISGFQTALAENLFSSIWFSFLAALGIGIFGYFFVGISAGIYKILEYLKIIKNEEGEIMPKFSILITKSLTENF